MPELIPVLSKKEIDELVSTISRRISFDYQGRDLVLVGVLKGAFVFLADLLRYLTIPVKVDFIRVASYGNDTHSSGNIQLTKEIELDLKNTDVLLVEDIIDTGLTIEYIINYLKSFDPLTIKTCTLLNKIERRKSKIKIDYSCHDVQNQFIVGYGLDYAENYRNLPGIYHLKL